MTRPRRPLARSLLFAAALLFFLPQTLASPQTAPETSPGPIRLRAVPSPRVRISAGPLRAGTTESELMAAAQQCARGATPDVRVLCRAMLQLARVPPKRVWLSAFAMDRLEVTQAAYARCVRQGRCTPTHFGPAAARGPGLPVTAVDHDQARAYCAFAGGALPTEAQWERAAEGPGTRAYPWGDYFDDSLANRGQLRGASGGAFVERAGDDVDGFLGVAPVGSFVLGASPEGVLDMAGNVREWVDDALPPNPGEESWSSAVDPRGPDEGPVFIARGGGYLSAPFELRVTHRWAEAADGAAVDLGFRCAYPLAP